MGSGATAFKCWGEKELSTQNSILEIIFFSNENKINISRWRAKIIYC